MTEQQHDSESLKSQFGYTDYEQLFPPEAPIDNINRENDAPSEVGKNKIYDPHANDEYYRAEELVEKAREIKLIALALALQAGLIKAAGLTNDLAKARRLGIDLPAVPSGEVITLSDIQTLNHQAESLFGQAQVIREEISRNSPKSAEEALAVDQNK